MSGAHARGASGRPRGLRRGLLLLLLSLVVVVGAVAAQSVVPPPEDAAPGTVPLDLATSGTAYCPVTAAEGDAASLLLVSAGAQDSEVTIVRHVDGVALPEESRVLSASSAALVELTPEQALQPIAVSWRGGPVLAQYRLNGEGEAAVATCATQPSADWHLAGFDTSLGSTSRLHLFNPFESDALVALRFGTPEGRVDLVIADELLVPARTSRALDLADFRPETTDMAVTVTARAGRVIAQGEVDLAPAAEGVEGVTGRALVPATAQPVDELWFADAVVDEVTASWLTVYNPADRAAAVAVRVSTPLSSAAALTTETSVPPGGTTRIDLAGLSALPTFGVQLSSVNGVPVAATRVSAVGDRDRTGVAVEIGFAGGALAWTVPGGSGGAGEAVTLYNPGAEPVVASVEIAGGMPETWTAVTVPPNGTARLALEGLTPTGPARVEADQPVVAGLISLRPESATAFWSGTGTATETLVGTGVGPEVVRDPTLVTIPALSATATPAATVPPVAAPGGEGTLDTEPEDAGPTPAPTAVAPAPPPPAAPAETPSIAAPPTPDTDGGVAPDPTEPAPTEEGSIFGKRRGVPRPRRS